MPDRHPDERALSRRTVVKGAVWAVPAIAVAAAAPRAAASGSAPPDPSFDWVGGCKSSGNSGKGCSSNKTYQVEVTATNTTPDDHVLWFSSYVVDGVALGLSGVFDIGTQAACGPLAPAPGTQCPVPADGFGVLVPSGATLDVWVASNSDSGSGGSNQQIDWEWIDADTCTVDASGTAQSAGTELFPPC